MSEDDTIPLLDDLVRSGIDPVADNEAAAVPQGSIDRGASQSNPPQGISLDQQIDAILQRHMDAARAEIIQLLPVTSNRSNRHTIYFVLSR